MSGNAVILKGGSDALNSNKAIVKVITQTLKSYDPNIVGACQLIEDKDRLVTREFMRLNGFVDLLIPRGGAGLIKSVIENATVPVIETGAGNCHVYIDESADFDMAKSILINAKTQRVSVCNCAESLVLHSGLSDEFVAGLAKELKEHGVHIRADEAALEKIRKCGLPAQAADETDFWAEYLDYIISVKTVDDVSEAIAHINKHSTRHSEAIITNNEKNAQRFMDEVDSACVYWNASTRFSDGFEFGFGAEIGISTQKIHARGPMGLNELTSYKYRITGNGQIRK